ncbi:hypothetical protein BSKO_08781 [Bryopsis sp. KO-2023]|nr:hypothetical protein BSKO_08781 [Bryopsis sp. KO-2023]
MVSKTDEVLYEDEELSFRNGDSLNGYQVNGRAGVGTFCVVFESQGRERPVAIKLAKQRYTSEKDVRAIDTEERVVAFLNQTYPEAPIINQIETFEHEGRRCMVMERAHGTLWDTVGLDWPTRKKLLFEIAVGLAVLEDAGVIHADLKPCNVLLVDDRPKLADFNCSKWFESSGRYYGENGTLRYMAPETLLDGVLDTSSDVWAYGCVAAAVLWGDDVFPQNTHVDVVGAIVDLLGQPPFESSLRTSFLELSRDDTRAYGSGYSWSLGELVSSSAVDECDGEHVLDLLSKVLQWSPENRLSPKKLLEHPLFAGMSTDVQFSNETMKQNRAQAFESLQSCCQSETHRWDIEKSCEWDSVADSSQCWGLDWGWNCAADTGGQSDWGYFPQDTPAELERSELSEVGWGEGGSVNNEPCAPWGGPEDWSNWDDFENYASGWKFDADDIATPDEEELSEGGPAVDTNSNRLNEVLGSVENDCEIENYVEQGPDDCGIENYVEQGPEEERAVAGCENVERRATIVDNWCFFWDCFFSRFFWGKKA